MALRTDAAAIGPELRALRRELHRHPETGLRLPRTRDRLLAALAGLPLDLRTGQALDSVTAVLRGGAEAKGPRRAALLRSDMDALPVDELSGEEFSSAVAGAMHACGHDLHMAALVGAARLLCARRAELPGDVVFMFQPGEEGHDGARLMLREGVLGAAGPELPVSAAYGLHVMSSGFPADSFACRPGPLMAASDALSVRVLGAGGHGSRPYDALDPVPVACEIVTALQTLVSRRFDVFDPVVVTVGEFHAGTRRNIIPDSAFFDATVRTFSAAARERIRELAVPLCEGIARAHGLSADVVFGGEGYPVTVNDADAYERVARTVTEVFGAERLTRLENPITGSEDFSRVLAEVPGAFVLLDAAYPAGSGREPEYNHSPRAAFDDRVLPDATTLLAELAVRELSQKPPGR